MQMDEHAPPLLRLLSAKTHIANRPRSQAEKQLHFSAKALKVQLPAPEDNEVSTLLGNSSFITPSKANAAMRCHQVFSGETPVLLRSEL